MASQRIDRWGVATISAAQTGNGATTDFADLSTRTDANLLGYPVVKITTTVGATPTCTYAIEGSMDGSSWYPVSYADIATPTTLSQATFAISTATTTRKVVQPVTPCRFLRITFSANTNVTNTVDVYSV